MNALISVKNGINCSVVDCEIEEHLDKSASCCTSCIVVSDIASTVGCHAHEFLEVSKESAALSHCKNDLSCNGFSDEGDIEVCELSGLIEEHSTIAQPIFNKGNLLDSSQQIIVNFQPFSGNIRFQPPI